MKHSLPSLDALKVFEVAARHLSFTLAADELCITKGAVSYQVRKLEESLDCALFRRSVRQVYLTHAGQQLMQTTQKLFAELDSTLNQIQPGDASHDVLIGATTYVASRWLSPRIAGFSEREPEVSILLHHAVNSEDFRLQDVDFAIRWGAIEGANARSRPLELPMPLFPVCSPRLLERMDIPIILPKRQHRRPMQLLLLLRNNIMRHDIKLPSMLGQTTPHSLVSLSSKC